jgi:hypothetical protein
MGTVLIKLNEDKEITEFNMYGDNENKEMLNKYLQFAKSESDFIVLSFEELDMAIQDFINSGKYVAIEKL